MSNASDLNDTARAHVEDIGAQAKAAATQEAVSQADKVKQATASQVQQAADAADAAASQLNPASPQAEAMKQVADHIEGVASQLRQADVRELASQVTDVARSNPMLFIGGAAIAGFAAARFLKARDPQPHSGADSDPWASSRGYAPDKTNHRTVMADINGGRSDV
ncbi:hypothetical protein BC777_3522 [Yoonia maricola]|uniref:ElaB/YqjD/DUF883 family membrane-anchored ribosome-binding protein n=1 Tax=Yoonia maricola TaxID=420999 RepID=A0A2M8W0L1_9RHOB|nr:hypothetical protein [Yoonia maricola]PJI84462.1 hypothetical protein BC777_3522 [Yoonia maricola]